MLFNSVYLGQLQLKYKTTASVENINSENKKLADNTWHFVTVTILEAGGDLVLTLKLNDTTYAELVVSSTLGRVAGFYCNFSMI